MYAPMGLYPLRGSCSVGNGKAHVLTNDIGLVWPYEYKIDVA